MMQTEATEGPSQVQLNINADGNKATHQGDSSNPNASQDSIIYIATEVVLERQSSS